MYGFHPKNAFAATVQSGASASAETDAKNDHKRFNQANAKLIHDFSTIIEPSANSYAKAQKLKEGQNPEHDQKVTDLVNTIGFLSSKVHAPVGAGLSAHAEIGNTADKKEDVQHTGAPAHVKVPRP